MFRLLPIGSLVLLSMSLASGQVSYGNLEITAKIVLEDGSPISSPPIVLLRIPGAEDLCSADEFFMDGTLRLAVPPRMIRGERQTGCHISIVLTGYSKFTGYVQDGTLIKLQRTGPQHESGADVSSTQLNIPESARKEYENGEAAASLKKWPSAEKHFNAAVAIYPQYALAWSELGQAIEEQGRMTDAAASFRKARESDPRYVKATVQLCLAEGALEHWDQEIKLSEEAIRINAVEFPAAYYCHAESAYHADKLDEADQYARQALKVDQAHAFLEPLILLGQIYEKHGNTRDAAVEYRNYLQLAPHGPRSAVAKEALARLKKTH